jgi:hypothetical protein
VFHKLAGTSKGTSTRIKMFASNKNNEALPLLLPLTATFFRFIIRILTDIKLTVVNPSTHKDTTQS